MKKKKNRQQEEDESTAYWTLYYWWLCWRYGRWWLELFWNPLGEDDDE